MDIDKKLILIAETEDQCTWLLAPIYLVSLIANKILPKGKYGFARGFVRTHLVDAHDESG